MGEGQDGGFELEECGLFAHHTVCADFRGLLGITQMKRETSVWTDGVGEPSVACSKYGKA